MKQVHWLKGMKKYFKEAKAMVEITVTEKSLVIVPLCDNCQLEWKLADANYPRISAKISSLN